MFQEELGEREYLLAQAVRYQSLSGSAYKPVLPSQLIILDCRNCTVQPQQLGHSAPVCADQLKPTNQVLNVKTCTAKRSVQEYMSKFPEISQIVQEIELMT